MSWQDNLREAAYTSPNRTRLEFLYENVEYSIDRKTVGFEFPQVNGSYVQDFGNTGRRYPMRIILSGDDYDVRAEQFMGMLSEVGVGLLEHPMYGPVNVIPFGKIVRNDRLKTAANQAVIEVTFWETIERLFLLTSTSAFAAVLKHLGDQKVFSTDDFVSNSDYRTVFDQVVGYNEVEVAQRAVDSFMLPVADNDPAILNE